MPITHLGIVAILILIAALSILLILQILTNFFANRKEVWHSPKRKSNEWDAVNELLRVDPIVHKDFILEPKYYPRRNLNLFLSSTLIRILAITTLILITHITLLSAADFSIIPKSLGDFDNWLKNHPNVSELIEAGIKFIPPVLAFLLAAFQIKASLTAHNRKKWIEDFRLAVVEAIMNIPSQEIRDKRYKSQSQENENDNNKFFADKKDGRTKLELLINPTEADHRVLSTLFRFAYGLTDPAELKLWHDQNLDKNKIGFLSKGSRPENFKHIIIVDFIVYEKIEYIQHLTKTGDLLDQNYLVSLIFRLSNAVLKREWERVKLGI
ncbi:hypothetical protein TH8_05995 [Thalassospira profundimaris]|nr:hypothetical protein TH8_05995 [Thalassospira profundimaris]